MFLLTWVSASWAGSLYSFSGEVDLFCFFLSLSFFLLPCSSGRGDGGGGGWYAAAAPWAWLPPCFAPPAPLFCWWGVLDRPPCNRTKISKRLLIWQHACNNQIFRADDVKKKPERLLQKSLVDIDMNEPILIWDVEPERHLGRLAQLNIPRYLLLAKDASQWWFQTSDIHQILCSVFLFLFFFKSFWRISS